MLKQWLKLAIVPVIVILVVIGLPKVAAFLINQHTDVGLLGILGLIGLVFSSVVLFIKNLLER